MATHWKGLDKQMPIKQKIRHVERAIQRLKETQTRGNSQYLHSLKREVARLRGEEKRTRKGLHLTAQAYR